MVTHCTSALCPLVPSLGPGALTTRKKDSAHSSCCRCALGNPSPAHLPAPMKQLPRKSPSAAPWDEARWDSPQRAAHAPLGGYLHTILWRYPQNVNVSNSHIDVNILFVISQHFQTSLTNMNPSSLPQCLCCQKPSAHTSARRWLHTRSKEKPHEVKLITES